MVPLAAGEILSSEIADLCKAPYIVSNTDAVETPKKHRIDVRSPGVYKRTDAEI